MNISNLEKLPLIVLTLYLLLYIAGLHFHIMWIITIVIALELFGILKAVHFAILGRFDEVVQEHGEALIDANIPINTIISFELIKIVAAYVTGFTILSILHIVGLITSIIIFWKFKKSDT